MAKANTLTDFKIINFNPTFWVYFFIVLHVLCWTLAPIFVRDNLPLDAIEGTIWGHQLQWGYDKNPFLNGWLTALATYLDGQNGWLLYGFSQLSVAACLWVVWKLGKMMLSPIHALIAVMLLEGLQYFNFHAIDFNDNTLELGLWALTIYYFYRVLTTARNDIFNWTLVGFFAGLGMMAKYYTAALLLPMALFLLLHHENRQQLKSPAPYFGLAVFLIIIAPHVAWLFSHHFITVKYVLMRTNSEPLWSNHYHFPLQFAWEQLQVFLPALLLFVLCFVGRKSFLSPRTLTNHFNKQFLWYVSVGPFLLTLLLGVLFGIKLRAGWGMPLLSFWPLLLLIYFPPQITKTRLFIFLIAGFSLMTILMMGYCNSLLRSDTKSSANFPGRELAQTITQQWHERYHTQLRFVAGSRWLGGNIGFYSKDHPAVFIEWDKTRAPWINLSELSRQGGVFIWNISAKETLPNDIKVQYPDLENYAVIDLPWKRNHYGLAPLKIGIAFLPPQS